MRLVSTIPAVLLAVTTVLSLLMILGGITSYYASIFMEPSVLPTYGSIYVKSVDPGKYVVEIVNRFGQSVRTVFSIYVTDVRVPGLAYNYTPSYVSFWYTIRPGESRIDLVTYVKEKLGLPENARVVIDLDNSYFIIGGVKYRLIQGAGIAEPARYGSSIARSITVDDIGSKYLTPYDRTATYYFSSSRVGVSHSYDVGLGYWRSVSEAEAETVTTYYESGTECDCRYYTYGGSRWDSDDRVCVYCTKRVYTCHKDPVYVKQQRTYYCANDGVRTLFTISQTKGFTSYFYTLSIIGVNYFATSIAKDTRTYRQINYAYSTEEWPYIVDREECIYTYTRRIVSASLRSGGVVSICDTKCGYSFETYSCTETSRTYSTTRYACGARDCAELGRFLFMRVREFRMNITSELTGGEVTKFSFNITYVVDYYRYPDPEDAEPRTIRLFLLERIGLGLPGIAGFVGLNYLDELRSVTVTIDASVRDFRATVKTESGYYRTVSLVYGVQTRNPLTTFTPVTGVLVPRGFESPKTYSIVTTRNPAVLITIETPSTGIPIPKQDSDTIVLNIYFELYITPRLTVNVYSLR